VEQAAAPPHLLQRPLLAGRWPELLFGGRAECAVGLPAGQALLPSTYCCLRACTPARGRTSASSPGKPASLLGLTPCSLRRARFCHDSRDNRTDVDCTIAHRVCAVPLVDAASSTQPFLPSDRPESRRRAV